jgi:hypothetical protein
MEPEWVSSYVDSIIGGGDAYRISGCVDDRTVRRPGRVCHDECVGIFYPIRAIIDHEDIVRAGLEHDDIGADRKDERILNLLNAGDITKVLRTDVAMTENKNYGNAE